MIQLSPEAETFSAPEPAVDWSTLTIIPSDDQDGEATMLQMKIQYLRHMGSKL